MYEIFTVPESAPEVLEQLGNKRKFWYWDEHNKKCMFKEGRPGTGENWAEKVASELCLLLQIPHALYELASWQQFNGVITPTIVPEGGRLVLGNELLQKFVSGYEKEKKYKQKQHTLMRVLILLQSGLNVNVPIGFEPTGAIESALDVFIGYLMFDAWIANQDRHHENWGVISAADNKVYLSPTFDHASGFGRNETDVNRQDRLTTSDARRNMATYVKKAISPFYLTPSSSKPLTTIEVFLKAATLRPRAGSAWLDRLSEIDGSNIASVFDSLPSGYASFISLQFAKKILELNKDRLLSLRGALA